MARTFQISILVLLFNSITLLSQNTNITCTLKDFDTHEAITGAKIFNKLNLKYTVSDNTGVFKLQANLSDTLCFSSIGYINQCVPVSLIVNTSTVYLYSKIIETQQIVINANAGNKNINSIESGSIELNNEQMRNMPVLLGERDPIRLLQLTPGVSKTEASQGISVRGGNTDQTLILLNGATVYNPTHLFGFYSVFNPTSISKVKLIKSGMPANYGGRLSSVIDIETNKGNFEKYEGEANFGILASNASISVPIIKSKLVWFISFRKTYIDELIKPIITGAFNSKSIRTMKSTHYSFYDLNTSLNYKIDSFNTLFINFYRGNDGFALAKSSFDLTNNIFWNNTVGTLLWTYSDAKNITITTNLSYSGYNFGFNAAQDKFKFSLLSQLNDIGFQHNYNFYFKKHVFRIGISGNKYYIKPNSSSIIAEDLDANFGTPNTFTNLQGAIFVNDEYEINTRLKINAGIRYTVFAHVGEYDKFIRNIDSEITDTIHYQANKLVKLFKIPEPRIMARYIIDSVSSVKAAYTYNAQMLAQVNVSAISLPTDFWIPASHLVKPQICQQYSVGYYRNFINNQYEASVELYYKNMSSQLEFKNGLLYSITKAAMEENLITGKGWAYGIEFFIKKNFGWYTGWVSYTLSRSMRQFAEINNGNPYPSKYDKIHDFSVLLSFDINKKWSFSSDFVYASGTALTLPIARYVIQGNIMNYYGSYNAFRMPAYHRLDIGFTRKLKKTKWFQSFLNISVYNVYNRLNPFYVYIKAMGDVKKNNIEVSAQSVAIFPILPSVSYQIKF